MTAAWLRERVFERLREAHTGVKPSVLRRAAQRIGLRLLGSWLSCWDPIHLGGVRASMRLEARVRRRLGPLVDLACEELFHGHVVPVQRVLEMIDESTAAALGKCVCRASRVTGDLESVDERGASVCYGIADPPTADHHLREILAAAARLDRGHGAPREETHQAVRDALRKVAEATDLSAQARLGLLWRETYPFWEILLAHDDVTPGWRENMRRHGKSRPIGRELLKAFVRAQYHTRGAIFTGMEVLDEPYALCTCPGPENDGGCSLVNWYYHSRLDGALHPNAELAHGQRRDADGRPLACRRFEARASRPCLGCGCEHVPE